jgi:type IV secretion system protein VirB3
MAQEGLTEDTLFLACTRPAMWQGVPLEAVAINGMATGIIFVLMSNPFYLLIGVVIHYTIRALISTTTTCSTRSDWAGTPGRARNKDRWGGSCPACFLRPAPRAQVRIHV